MDAALQDAIKKGKTLKKVQTNDRSAPTVAGNTSGTATSGGGGPSPMHARPPRPPVAPGGPPLGIGDIFAAGRPKLRSVSGTTAPAGSAPTVRPPPPPPPGSAPSSRPPAPRPPTATAPKPPRPSVPTPPRPGPHTAKPRPPAPPPAKPPSLSAKPKPPPPPRTRGPATVSYTHLTLPTKRIV